MKSAPGTTQQVERHLQQFSGVDDISANPLTGNVLIRYCPSLSAQEAIISALQEVGYLSSSITAVGIRVDWRDILPDVVEEEHHPKKVP